MFFLTPPGIGKNYHTTPPLFPLPNLACQVRSPSPQKAPSCSPNMSFISKAAPLPEVTTGLYVLKTAGPCLGNMVCSICISNLQVQPNWSLGLKMIHGTGFLTADWQSLVKRTSWLYKYVCMIYVYVVCNIDFLSHAYSERRHSSFLSARR